MKRNIIFALMAVAASSQALVIDDFTTGSFGQSINSGNWVGSQAGTMLGGERDAALAIVTNPLSQSLQMIVGGGMQITNAGTLTEGRVGLDYDGIGDETNTSTPFEVGPGLGSLNMASFSDRIRLNFLANDLPLTAAVMVYTYETNASSTLSFTVAGGQVSPFSLDFDYASFTGTADFSDIDRIVIGFQTAPSGDFALSSVEAVPEPASLMAIGLGLAGIVARRRKK